jgi:hypothetical protein
LTFNLYHCTTADGVGGAARENPHKYLVYKPSARQLLLALATAVEEMPHSSALLVYVSASAAAPVGGAAPDAAGLCLSPPPSHRRGNSSGGRVGYHGSQLMM